MRSLRSLFLIVLLLAPGRAVAAPPFDFVMSPQLGGGLSTNLPKQWFGFCLFRTRPEQIGFYIDLKTAIPMIYGGDDYYENITSYAAEGWGDELKDEKVTWLSFNAAITKVLASRVAMYLGAGYSLKSTYRNYHDEFHILGTNGSYWVLAGDSGTVNGLGGLLIGTDSNWGIQLGGEARPPGVTLGVFWTNPR
jgi:hypothetical protein